MTDSRQPEYTGAMEIETLTQRLSGTFSSHLICGPGTQLLVEGYPRSANSFCVDMIVLLRARVDSNPLIIAHHTHSPDQLILADQLHVPALILIRDPVDAILSYSIFSGRDPEYCIDRYRSFYKTVLKMTTPLMVADFAEITQDFNKVVLKINALLGNILPFSKTLESDTSTVLTGKKERAIAAHGDLAVERMGIPNPDRERIKTRLRAKVSNAVDKASDLRDLYDSVMQLRK